MGNLEELRYQNPSQCCNCGPEVDESPEELRWMPILSPKYGGTYRLSNLAIVCRDCLYATLYGSDGDYESNDYLPNSERRKERKNILEMDNYTCCACGRVVDTEEWRDAQTHHIRPVGRGGSNRITNKVTKCKDCHDTKNEIMKSDALEQIHAERARSVLNRAGRVLERSRGIPVWELPENAPPKALNYYENQYDEIEALITHFEESPLPTKQMMPFIAFLDGLKLEAMFKRTAVKRHLEAVVERANEMEMEMEPGLGD